MLKWPRLSSTLEILIIVVLMAVLLFAVAYTLDIQDGVIFASFLVAIIGMVGGLLGTGFGGYLGFIAANNRRPADARRLRSWRSCSRSPRTARTPTCRSPPRS